MDVGSNFQSIIYVNKRLQKAVVLSSSAQLLKGKHHKWSLYAFSPLDTDQNECCSEHPTGKMLLFQDRQNLLKVVIFVIRWFVTALFYDETI